MALCKAYIYFFFLTNIFIQEIDVHNTVKTGVKVVPLTFAILMNLINERNDVQ